MKKELRFEKIVMIFAIIMFIICLVAFFLFFVFQKNKKEEKKKEYPISNLVNDSETLMKEHCLDDVCMKDLTIGFIPAEEKEYEMTVVSAKMINKGSEKRDTCIKIRFFQVDKNNTKDFKICAYDLEPNKELDIETQENEEVNDLVFYEDYFLEHMTDEEITEFYQSIQ